MTALQATPAVRHRVTVLWFPDWPVYALAMHKGWDLLAPAGVIKDHRVLACNTAARRAGVRAGMKQRTALATCPTLMVAEDDPTLQTGVHEEVLAALEQVAAGVETIRPGLLAFPMHSLAKFYGTEDVALEKLLNASAQLGADCLAGIADDLITAVWAARAGKTISPGAGAEFIATLPIAALTVEPALRAPAGLVDTLSQLGVCTLADFAALPIAHIAGRFGQEAVEWHRIASGQAERGVSPAAHASSAEVTYQPDEPINSTSAAAFVARQVAAQLHQQLFSAGQACLRLGVRARMTTPMGYEGPAHSERVWRCQEPLTEQETAQRIRWQLDGWITRMRANVTGPEDAADGSAWDASAVGISSIDLIPLDVVPAGTLAEPLWGGPDEGVRAARAAAGRAQALIGTQAVRRPVHRGGRAVAGRIVTVPYGEQDPEDVSAQPTDQWTGQLIAPLPGLIGPPPVMREGMGVQGGVAQQQSRHPAATVHVCDQQGTPIYVTQRGMLNQQPDTLRWGNTTHTITGWAGPWPVDEHWWAAGKRYARMQVATRDAQGNVAAFLLVCKGTRWRIEATY
ncbi:MAG TPA: DNA polymerase Y family protein [Candidatus Corynebacterium gallistercoris]|uniref:DNA polymerase Y family protein n=1 Tax=Candidatus Corynebacterium gallistercoris TaxID=2838530 RepID=A0A9D1RWJ7_9CORY|nr:DNA polymerase Y family protein [Candidatus Corynebacterium gallistercoris]